MADPFTALTVCCAALQFLDFGAKFIEKTYKVYKSTDGATRNVIELEVAAGRLKAAARANDAQQSQTASTTPAESRLITLCSECETFADKLVNSLATPKTNGKPGLRESAKMVFKVDRRREELRASEKRLEALRLEMNAQLLSILSIGCSALRCSHALEATNDIIDDRQAAATRTLNDIQARDAASSASMSNELKQLRSELVSRLDLRYSQGLDPDDVRSLLERLINDAKVTKVKQSLLGSLYYEGMNTRREVIHETHADTYEWIYSPDEERGRTAHLQEWLKTGRGIFWVSGKPGSGKSTLMKLLSGHSRTFELLHVWAANSRLIAASFYFWTNGNEMQKSQAGLLRSMCASVVQQCPDLFLDLWWQMGSLDEQAWSQNMPRAEWSIATLKRMLEVTQNSQLRHQGRPIRFAFFLDGLDEYSGDPEELIKIIQTLASSENVKLCASSRPWNIFERAFGGNDQQKLYMQQLTHGDISRFVWDKIGTDDHFQQLLDEDERAQDIIDEIVSRANGVFLWVYLVERQVRRSLVNKDGLGVLRKRVLQMPSDLNAYFQHMFNGLVRIRCRTWTYPKSCISRP